MTNTDELALNESCKADSERLQFLIDSQATVSYSQRPGEDSPHVEVHGAGKWCRRKTLREAIDVLRLGKIKGLSGLTLA